jgi:N-acetylated-alpha-linked acidic dipeptidase
LLALLARLKSRPFQTSTRRSFSRNLIIRTRFIRSFEGNRMNLVQRTVAGVGLACAATALLGFHSDQMLAQSAAPAPAAVFGYGDFSAEEKIESEFLAIPDAKLAGQHLKTLTAQPHLSATPEDHATAEYVAQKFRAAGLETEIVPYRVLLNRPIEERVEAFDGAGKLLMSGPTKEHVEGDKFQDNPRVTMPYHGSSASGDVTGEAVYANYGRIEDFDQLAAQHIDLHGKIVVVRYGNNFRGIKVYLAEQRGAVGVLIYSDPQDDGYYKGDAWPLGPWRPETGVQMGSVQNLSRYAGDPTTPGVASTPDLPDSARLPADKTGNQPHIPSLPLSYHDAAPILRALAGPGAPQGWQGALPFRYHLGGAGVRVHILSKQDYALRTIWDVIGKVTGATAPDEWVVAGNHRDAWVYGAVDPSSGTAAMLEAVHGVGGLLKQGWRPKRTMVFCSWDAEEQGLIGSTEWVEQHAKALEHAVAYFNVDVAVSGPDFSASAVPSLKQFVREVTRSVPSPLGATVYDQWRIQRTEGNPNRVSDVPDEHGEVRIGDLGSGSDFTPFFQHVGVPSTDIGSGGPYGVYHSVFDNYDWFVQNADPHFVYLEQMARVLGLEAVRMADADVLPYDYVTYANSIGSYSATVKRKAQDAGMGGLDFGPLDASVGRFLAAAQRVHARQLAPTGNLTKVNAALRQTEGAFVTDEGLPNRSWYKHTVFAPGLYTGYAAVVMPGVSEAIDSRDAELAKGQLGVLTRAVDRATAMLNGAE